MKYFFLLSWLLPISLSGQERFADLANLLTSFSEENRPQVMVIGTFHYKEYTGDDSGNTYTGNPPDMMSTMRQQELDSLVNVLKTFKPTKVCIEVSKSNQERIDREFEQFKTEGSDERNEYIQLGFRLAKALDNERVYAVDMTNNWYMDSLMQYAMTNGQGQLLMKAGQVMPEFLEKHYDAMNGVHINEVYSKMNEYDELRAIHAFHQSFAAIGKDDNYIGTNLYHDWMDRNNKIFTNVLRVAESKDRIVVIYGAAHVHSLKTLFKDSFDFDLVDVQEYLK